MKLRLIVASLLVCATAAAADKPSRAPFDNCRWQKLSDRTLGLEAWVQRCTSPKSEFVVQDHALAMKYADTKEPYLVVRLFDLLPGETAARGLRRIFDARTDATVAKRCVIAPYEPASKRAGVKRYTFVPNKAYQKELDAADTGGDIPDPPCGDLGTQPDFVQYWEVQPASGSRKVMLIDAGQDTPLFDEETLRLLPPPK